MITVRMGAGLTGKTENSLVSAIRYKRMRGKRVNGIWYIDERDLASDTHSPCVLYRLACDMESKFPEYTSRLEQAAFGEEKITEIIKGAYDITTMRFKEVFLDMSTAMHAGFPELSKGAKERIGDPLKSEAARSIYTSDYIENVSEDAFPHVLRFLGMQVELEMGLCAAWADSTYIKAWREYTSENRSHSRDTGAHIVRWSNEAYEYCKTCFKDDVGMGLDKICGGLIAAWVIQYLDGHGWRSWDWLSEEEAESLWQYTTGIKYFWALSDMKSFLIKETPSYNGQRLASWRHGADIGENNEDENKKILVKFNLKGFDRIKRTMGKELESLRDMRDKESVEYIYLYSWLKEKRSIAEAAAPILEYSEAFDFCCMPAFRIGDSEDKKDAIERIKAASLKIDSGGALCSMREDSIKYKWNKKRL